MLLAIYLPLLDLVPTAYKVARFSDHGAAKTVSHKTRIRIPDAPFERLYLLLRFFDNGFRRRLFLFNNGLRLFCYRFQIRTSDDLVPVDVPEIPIDDSGYGALRFPKISAYLVVGAAFKDQILDFFKKFCG